MNQIVIDCGFNQDRVALLENDELVELYIEEDKNKRILGNVYKARVVNVLPGMQAAFVDIGLKKNAFLYVKDAIPKEMLLNKDIDLKDISIRDVVKTGQEIIVQIMKEAIGTKGPRVTTHISLPGRYLVLMPYTDYIGISRRINDREEKNRLKEIAKSIKPKGKGVILRTAAKGKSEEELKDDIKFLLKLHQKIEKEKDIGYAPRIVFKDMDLIHRTVRDLFAKNIDKIIINDKEKYESIIELADILTPYFKNKIEYFDDGFDVFSHFNIDSMIEKALDKKIWLKNGSYLIIDKTEALTSIDVNTGKYVGNINLEDTVYKTNIESAKEIAKQLRLRNIGGIIIIDFIDMTNEEDIKSVIHCLENEMKKDRTKSTVLGITRLGLVEMTRKKSRKRIASKILTTCPYCEGTGKIYSEDYIINKIEKEMKRIKTHTNSEAVLFNINSYIFNILEEKKEEYIKYAEKRYDIKIFIEACNGVELNDIKVKKMGKIGDVKKLIEN